MLINELTMHVHGNSSSGERIQSGNQDLDKGGNLDKSEKFRTIKHKREKEYRRGYKRHGNEEGLTLPPTPLPPIGENSASPIRTESPNERAVVSDWSMKLKSCLTNYRKFKCFFPFLK